MSRKIKALINCHCAAAFTAYEQTMALQAAVAYAQSTRLPGKAGQRQNANRDELRILWRNQYFGQRSGTKDAKHSIKKKRNRNKAGVLSGEKIPAGWDCSALGGSNAYMHGRNTLHVGAEALPVVDISTRETT